LVEKEWEKSGGGKCSKFSVSDDGHLNSSDGAGSKVSSSIMVGLLAVGVVWQGIGSI